MTGRRGRTLLVVVPVVVVAGCGREPDLVQDYVAEGAAASDHHLGPSISDAAETDAFGLLSSSVAWADDGRYLAVTTMGSSSCPSVPSALDWDGGVLRIALADRYPDAEACTADLGPYTVVVDVPDGPDPGSATAVDLAGTDLTLPPAR